MVSPHNRVSLPPPTAAANHQTQSRSAHLILATVRLGGVGRDKAQHGTAASFRHPSESFVVGSFGALILPLPPAMRCDADAFPNRVSLSNYCSFAAESLPSFVVVVVIVKSTEEEKTHSRRPFPSLSDQSSNVPSRPCLHASVRGERKPPHIGH